jgi:hypothetical protein
VVKLANKLELEVVEGLQSLPGLNLFSVVSEWENGGRFLGFSAATCGTSKQLG